MGWSADKGEGRQTGISSSKEGKAEIRDAVHLWGKDSYQIQKMIKDELNDDGVSVAGIGVGGERLIKYAAIMNDAGRAAGRCGMGASWVQRTSKPWPLPEICGLN